MGEAAVVFVLFSERLAPPGQVHQNEPTKDVLQSLPRAHGLFPGAGRRGRSARRTFARPSTWSVTSASRRAEPQGGSHARFGGWSDRRAGQRGVCGLPRNRRNPLLCSWHILDVFEVASKFFFFFFGGGEFCRCPDSEDRSWNQVSQKGQFSFSPALRTILRF